jgi:two-component system chemotaxis response regulator CheB
MSTILIAEDDRISALTFNRVLERAGHQVTVVGDGAEAIALLRRQRFDVLVTDWMMPRIDGIQLIEQTRKLIDPVPFIVMVTAIASEEARQRSLDAGADYYLAKPVSLHELAGVVADGLARQHQPPPIMERPAPRTGVVPPYVGVVVAVSTGGPQALGPALRTIPADLAAPVFVVQHAPAWMMETFAPRLASDVQLPVELAQDGARPQPGRIYLANGDRHLAIDPNPVRMRQVDAPKENYIRPAADWLFRTAAPVFGEYCVAVVMTGLGRDGALGAGHIAAQGGVVLAQDPATCTMPFMPQAVLNLGIVKETVPLTGIGEAVTSQVRRLNAKLRRAQAA